MLRLIGFLLPPLIDLINRKIKDQDLRFWISVGVCVVMGTILEYTGHNFYFVGIDSWVTSMFAVFGIAQVSYKFWDKSNIRKNLDLNSSNQAPKIELPKFEPDEGGDN